MTVTNIYPIENLGELRCKYRMYEVKGIPLDLEDYYAVTERLAVQLSGTTHSPCVVQRKDGRLLIAQLEGHESLPAEFPAVGARASIEPFGETRELNFGSPRPDEIPLALRFLQFHVVGLFKSDALLWLPKSGAAIFQKTPDQVFLRLTINRLNMYRGFTFRFMHLPRNHVGLCVDVTHKYVDGRPLPAIVTRDDFRRYKGKNCVYEYGETWYQIKIEGLLDQNVTEVKLPDGNTLYEHLRNLRWGNRWHFFASLPRDGSVLIYHTSAGEVRRVPSALCRLVYATNSPLVRSYHSYTILEPEQRRNEIEYVMRKYLRGTKFQGTDLVFAEKPLEFEANPFALPELLFGNGKVLAVEQGSKSEVPLRDWGPAKKKLLLSADAGFFRKSPLQQQYLVLPKSIKESFGDLFVEHLKEQFKIVYSPTGEFEYNPSIMVFDDSVGRSVPVLGNEIIRTMTRNIFYSGYGVVMIPRLRETRESTEDELANLLMRELRKRDIYVSVMHTDQARQTYVRSLSANGQPRWEMTRDGKQAGRFRSYLQNVAINKILLLNSRWPFVLANTLHADLTIGLDVKNNTAGFTFILKDGRTIWCTVSDSQYSERLSNAQCSSVVYNELKKQLSEEAPLRNAVIHRDGTTYPEEMEGIRDGFERLAKDRLIANDFDASFVDVHKTSRAPVRLFESLSIPGSQTESVRNPQVGTHLPLFDSAYICTTGYPYTFHGTAKPIHVIKVSGNMPFELILEDLFRLSNLTWTRVDDCSRVPISIKMTDIRLREVAGDYDRDAFRFATPEEES